MIKGSVSVVSPGAYLVSDGAGDVRGPEDGLFFRDVRHLSRFVLLVDGGSPEGLGYEARGSGAGFRLRAGDVDVARRREAGFGMREEVSFTNRSPEAVEVSVEVECAADFLDIFEVRGWAKASERGELGSAVEGEALRFSYRRGDFRRGTVVRVSGAETCVEPGVIRAGFRLGGGAARTLRVSVAFEEGGEEVRRREVGALYGDAPELETSSEPLRRSWEQSVEDLSSLSFDVGEGLFVPAAGSPWYMALFGRDALLTGYMTMVLSPEPAKNALRALARWQAEIRDDFTDAEPGKILHEMRHGELAFFGESPESPYYGTADATPLFLVLLEEVRRWTGDEEFVREMEGVARRALGWILAEADRVNGYVAYRTRSTGGLENQGWKDSDDSMLFRDGSRAKGSIAPCEVQGYVYDALARTARLAERVWEDPSLARELRSRAEDLRRRFDRDFWMEDRGYYALALDGEGRKVDSITSNAGHLLWSGIVPPEKARSVAEKLMDETLFSGWGVRTMATSEGGYDPLSYHNGSVWPHDNALIAEGLGRYGFREEAACITAAILKAASHFEYRLPEVFAGYSRLERPEPEELPKSCSPQAWAVVSVPSLVKTVLGVEPDPETRSLRAEPFGVSGIRLGGVNAFGERHDIEADITTKRGFG